MDVFEHVKTNTIFLGDKQLVRLKLCSLYLIEARVTALRLSFIEQQPTGASENNTDRVLLLPSSLANGFQSCTLPEERSGQRALACEDFLLQAKKFKLHASSTCYIKQELFEIFRPWQYILLCCSRWHFLLSGTY